MDFLPETRFLCGNWHLPIVLDTSATCLKRAQVRLTSQWSLILRTPGSAPQVLRYEGAHGKMQVLGLPLIPLSCDHLAAGLVYPSKFDPKSVFLKELTVPLGGTKKLC